MIYKMISFIVLLKVMFSNVLRELLSLCVMVLVVKFKRLVRGMMVMVFMLKMMFGEMFGICLMVMLMGIKISKRFSLEWNNINLIVCSILLGMLFLILVFCCGWEFLCGCFLLFVLFRIGFGFLGCNDVLGMGVL